jgi:hypothetical protein
MQILGSQITIIKTYVIIIAGREEIQRCILFEKDSTKQAPTTSDYEIKLHIKEQHF